MDRPTLPPQSAVRSRQSVVTDSRGRREPKDTSGSALFQLYEAFATPGETATMRAAFTGGIAWGDAKQALFERIDVTIAPLRAHYDEIVAQPSRIEQRLLEGAVKTRALATPFLGELREAVGLRSLSLAE